MNLITKLNLEHLLAKVHILEVCAKISQKSLEPFGCMSNLNRIQVGNFNISNAILLEDLENIDVAKNVITIEKLFEKNDEIFLENDKKLDLFLNGVRLSCDKLDGVYRVYLKDKFIGIGVVENKLLKRDIII